jgi:hypothetical protein
MNLDFKGKTVLLPAVAVALGRLLVICLPPAGQM